MSKNYCKKMADGGSVGLFERLKAGNIDDPSSEAYKRWGAGSKADDSPAPAPAPADDADIPDAAPRESVGNEDGLKSSSYKASDNYGDRADSAPAKPARKATPKAKPATSASYSNEGRNSKAPAAAPSAPKSIYDSSRDRYSAENIGKGIKNLFSSGAAAARNSAYANGGMIGGVKQTSGPGSARSYGKK